MWHCLNNFAPQGARENFVSSTSFCSVLGCYLSLLFVLFLVSIYVADCPNMLTGPAGLPTAPSPASATPTCLSALSGNTSRTLTGMTSSLTRSLYPCSESAKLSTPLKVNSENENAGALCVM